MVGSLAGGSSFAVRWTAWGNEVVEIFVRAARLPTSLLPVPIYAGEPPEPIPASWLAVSHTPEHSKAPERFLLYFLSESGELCECLQFETLESALDQARAIARLPQSAWRPCEVQIGDEWERLDVDAFPI